MTEAGVPAAVGVVVIGRNEGARLLACLASLAGVGRVVYVDSGSTDGSAAAAGAAGAEVVALDLSRPFTAARARNAGLARLRAAGPPRYVQFLDGDCVLRAGWIDTARAYLEARSCAAVACGRRRERFPEASIYNRLCDWEWATPVGKAKACGGDALMRIAALEDVGGFRDGVIAAEDDELCARLRAAGWEIWRLDAEMTWHDAAILRFGQWWRRGVRAGHGFAEVGAYHPDHFRAERRRVWVWGVFLPTAAAVGLLAGAPAVALGAFGLYGLSCARGGVRFLRGGMPTGPALGCAGLITLSKLSNVQGLFTYHWHRARGQAARIIEYK